MLTFSYSQMCRVVAGNCPNYKFSLVSHSDSLQTPFHQAFLIDELQSFSFCVDSLAAFHHFAVPLHFLLIVQQLTDIYDASKLLVVSFNWLPVVSFWGTDCMAKKWFTLHFFSLSQQWLATLSLSLVCSVGLCVRESFSSLLFQLFLLLVLLRGLLKLCLEWIASTAWILADPSWVVDGYLKI